MEEEMASMNINSVWSLVECPKNKKPIRCKWIFKKKTGPDGNVCSYKARLVAQGYAQKFGVDYDETFSPVVRFESVRAVLALAAKHNLQLHHMDVATAFLNGELSEEIYLTQPEGFVSEGNENLVCRLNKSLYELKQSPKCWNTALDGHLKQLGFKQSKNDACIYTRNNVNVAKYCSEPLKNHWTGVKRLFRYMKGTSELGILYSNCSDKCIGCSDADWAGDRSDRKSTSGYCFTLSNSVITWRSVKQSCAALSTAEAEYVALAGAAQEAIWLTQLLDDLEFKTGGPMVVNEDNQSAICLAQ
ncbi:Reverse transcriptase RNA-dependent DNA polymerase, partial [Trinorchestia longiramus]